MTCQHQQRARLILLPSDLQQPLMAGDPTWLTRCRFAEPLTQNLALPPMCTYMRASPEHYIFASQEWSNAYSCLTPATETRVISWCTVRSTVVTARLRAHWHHYRAIENRPPSMPGWMGSLLRRYFVSHPQGFIPRVVDARPAQCACLVPSLPSRANTKRRAMLGCGASTSGSGRAHA